MGDGTSNLIAIGMIFAVAVTIIGVITLIEFALRGLKNRTDKQ